MKVVKGLEEIMPRWTKKIERNEHLPDILQECRVDRRKLDLADNEKCMVGEAWLFNDDYEKYHTTKSCQICDAFSMTFFRIPKYLGTDKELEKTFRAEQRKFIRHFYTVHPRLVEEHKKLNKGK